MARIPYTPTGADVAWTDLIDDLFSGHIRYWTRNGENSGALADSSPNARTTNLGGTITRLDPGSLGAVADDDGAIRLDGTTNYLTVTGFNPLATGSTFSVFSRLRRPSPSTVNDVWFSTNSATIIPVARFTAAGILQWYPQGFTGNGVNYDPAFGIGWPTFDAWDSAVLNYTDSSGATQFGLGGVLQPEYTVATTRLPAAGSDILQIGASGSLLEHKAKMDIDEFLVLDRVMTESEFSQLHEAAEDSSARPTASVAFDRTLPVPATWSSRASFPKAGFNPQALDSHWYNPIPDDARIHPNSDNICQFLYDNGAAADANGPGGPGYWTHAPAYGYPVYFSNSGDSLYTIDISNIYGTNPYDGDTFRCPPGMSAASGTDGHLGVIYQDGTQMHLWQVTNINDTTHTITCTWGNVGGLTLYEGVYQDNSSIGINASPMAGLVHASELMAGEINHALGMVVTETQTDKHAYPAFKNPGEDPDPDAPYAGQRFRSTYTLEEIDAMTGVSDWQKTWMRCFRTYGAIVNDTGGYQIGRLLGHQSYTYLGYENELEVFWDQRNAAGDTKVYNNAGTKTFLQRNGWDWTRVEALDVYEGLVFP